MEPYAAFAETHISVVFFAGDRAYKLLKPLRTDFLDHSTTERRAVACHRELELNRRLAPDVYLGVSDIVERGVVTDHLLVMRRMPTDRRLTAVLTTAERDDALRNVARRIAAFHAGERPSSRAAECATALRVAERWERCIDAMRPFAGGPLDAAVLEQVAGAASDYVHGRDRLFDARIAEGYARDGHGDLLAEDIFCLDDGPRILDCLAFDDDLRMGDVLEDVAFLVMDLERLAGADVAEAFMGWYQEYSNERHPQSLVDLYVAYRALVRSKVNCLRAEQGVGEAADEARRHLDLCARRLASAAPCLVLVGGLPGTGKSTSAGLLAGALGWALLSSDELRKDLVGLGHEEHAFAEPGAGIYRADVTERVYALVAARASELLARGESVVVDASFTASAHRAALRDVAGEARAALVELRCVLDPATARHRVARRLVAEQGPSDATPAIVDHLAAASAPWPEAISLDTSVRTDVVAAYALQHVREGRARAFAAGGRPAAR